MHHVDLFSSSGTTAVHDVSPPQGHYDSPEALVKQLNAIIASKESKKNLTRFSYNEISKKIKITFGSNVKLPTILIMSKMFAELAGFFPADVKPVLSEQEDEKRKKVACGRKSKDLPTTLLLAPTFATCNAASACNMLITIC